MAVATSCYYENVRRVTCQGFKNYVHVYERAPTVDLKTSIRYKKKRAPKINSNVYVLQKCYK